MRTFILPERHINGSYITQNRVNARRKEKLPWSILGKNSLPPLRPLSHSNAKRWGDSIPLPRIPRESSDMLPDPFYYANYTNGIYRNVQVDNWLDLLYCILAATMPFESSGFYKKTKEIIEQWICKLMHSREFWEETRQTRTKTLYSTEKRTNTEQTHVPENSGIFHILLISQLSFLGK